MQDWEREDLIGDIEYLYTNGNSFGVGEADVLVWLLENGWTITPPKQQWASVHGKED